MGMAASQVRFLHLTGRKADIGRQLQSLSLDKMSLARDMKRVTKEYQEALNSKVLKWSRNAGATYVDLSYNNLMRPNSANGNTPYLLTDNNGKVVLDSKYQKYAEIISPDGNAYGDWESNRTAILSQLTGIPAESIEQYAKTNDYLDSAADKQNSLQNEVDRAKSKCTKNYTTENFVKNCFGDVTYVTNENKIFSGNVFDEYKDSLSDENHTWELGTSSQNSQEIVNNIIDQIAKKASNYLFDSDLKAFNSAVEATKNIYKDYFAAAETDTNKKDTAADLPIFQKNNSYQLDFDQLIDCLINQYEAAGASTHSSSSNCDITYFETTQRDSEDYNNYIAKLAELDTAKAEYKNAVDTNNQVLTAEQESAIAFYDKIFSAIADKGWTCDPKVEDKDYLNNYLQNNQYYITTMNPRLDEDGKNYYEYETNIATNMDFIFPVNDTDIHNEALVDYEYEKSIISEKESRIDTRMQDLQTEQSAINEMLKGIESVRNDNIERNFSIMS